MHACNNYFIMHKTTLVHCIIGMYTVHCLYNCMHYLHGIHEALIEYYTSVHVCLYIYYIYVCTSPQMQLMHNHVLLVLFNKT